MRFSPSRAPNTIVPPATCSGGLQTELALTAGLLSFNTHGNTHATADAQCSETLARIATTHFEKKRRQHPGPGRTNRVTNGNCTTIDVDDVSVPAEFLVHGASLCSKRFVCFDKVKIPCVPACFFERSKGGRDGPGSHQSRINAGGRPRHNSGKRFYPAAIGFFLSHQDGNCGTVVDARGVAGRDGAFLVEGSAQLLHTFQRRTVANILVIFNDKFAFAALHSDWRNLLLEAAGLLRSLSLVLGGKREGVLLVTGDLEGACDVFRGYAHMVSKEGIQETVAQERIDHGMVAHLHAPAEIGTMRRKGHGFLTAGDDDVSIAAKDLLHANRDRPQARAAKLIEIPGRAVMRDTCRHCRLSRRILALPCRQYLSEDHFSDFVCRHASAFQCTANGHGTKFVSRHLRKRAIERTDRCSCSTGNNDRPGRRHLRLRHSGNERQTNDFLVGSPRRRVVRYQSN